MNAPNPSRAARLLEATARFSTARRREVAAGAAALSAVFAAAAFVGLETSAGTSSLVPKAAGASAATDRVRAAFGDDAIVVMVQGKLRDVVLSPDLGRILALEGCLGGRIPKGAKPYGGESGPCARIARDGFVRRVYGPATFVNEAARQVYGQVGGELQRAAQQVKQAGEAARSAALAQGLGKQAADRAASAASLAAQREVAAKLARLQVQTGIRGLPSIANSEFVSQIVFDASRGAGEPKARFAYLFPSSNSAVIQVRPRPGLTDSQRQRLASQVREATRVQQFRLSNGIYRVTGVPVLAESLADEVAAGALPLLLAAAVAMALALGFAFRVGFRLLALVTALATACIVFGAMGLLGLPLTVAAVGGLPVLIGLAVDYAVQYQARVAERLRAGEAAEAALPAAARSGGPPILAAAAATSAGFLALLLSPVPMVRGFGLVLIAGVAIAFIVAFTLGASLMAFRPAGDDRISRVAAALDSSVAGAREIISGLPGSGSIGRTAGRVSGWARAHPRRLLAVAVAVAVAGWAVESLIPVESDVSRLVPSGTPALQDLKALQAESGVAGEVDVLVSGADALDPGTLKWIRDFRSQALTRWGFAEDRGCRDAILCPGVSVTDIIPPTANGREVAALLRIVPEYFRSATVAVDRKAVLASFGINLLPLERQQEVFDDLRRRASGAPRGVRVDVGGLPVIAAEANSRIADPVSRVTITLLALALVALVLLVTFRSPARVAVPLLATVLATGWANLGLWLSGVELNPLSAALGALVIAIATEFAVLLSERQRSERDSGKEAEAALTTAIGTTGRAVAVSGLTVVTGFGVLVFSDIRILRDFGIATAIDLTLALAAVAVVVPAVIRLAARGSSGPRSGADGGPDAEGKLE